jgi:hypothetical protein
VAALPRQRCGPFQRGRGLRLHRHNAQRFINEGWFPTVGADSHLGAPPTTRTARKPPATEPGSATWHNVERLVELGLTPAQVAFVYRHYPLSHHRNSAQASRIAECAGEPDYFWAAHQYIYGYEDLAEMNAENIGISVGIPNLKTFLECSAGTEPVSAIVRDVGFARTLDVRATPTNREWA